MAAVCTFLPDSQRDRVLLPSRSIRAEAMIDMEGNYFVGVVCREEMQEDG